MIIYLWPPGEKDGLYRNWPCPPRCGDDVRVGKVDYVVTEVNWGDHLTGSGEPIIDKPCADVILEVPSD